MPDHETLGPGRAAPDDGTPGPTTVPPTTGPPTVTGAHVARALDDLLDSAQAVTRSLLGVGVDPTTLPAGGALAMNPAMLMAQRRSAIRAVFRG